MKGIILMVGIATVLAGVLTFSHARSSSPVRKIASGYSVDFVVVEDGKLVSRVRRQVKSNGDFMEDTDHLHPDGSLAKHTRLAGSSTHGAVSINDAEKKLTYMGPAGVVTAVTEAELKAEGYDREDSLLGLRVIVQRKCDAENRCTEYWIAPELGYDSLKVDVMFADGRRLTKEAVALLKVEPSFAVPNYPSDIGTRATSAKP